MRLITRSDFDGLACAVFLKEAGIINSCKFAHPKDLQDGLIEVEGRLIKILNHEKLIKLGHVVF